VQIENSSGDYLYNTRDCYQCYDVGLSEELAYCDAVYDAKTCHDVSSFGEKIERVYMSGTVGLGCFGILFTFAGRINCSDLLYCFDCFQSKDCFGCTSLKRKQYCIFNKQYSQEEYEKLSAQIIEHMQKTGEWGEFFPPSMSPFGYNETVANDYFPDGKENVQKRGWHWYDKSEEKDQYLGPTFDLPDVISDVPENICEKILLCEESKKPFKVVPQELEFYKQQNLPIPRLCPDARHLNRFARRNPRHLWQRKCDKCGKTIASSYDTDRPEQVYCEKCYLQAVH
jgi:hypothetical protein